METWNFVFGRYGLWMHGNGFATTSKCSISNYYESNAWVMIDVYGQISFGSAKLNRFHESALQTIRFEFEWKYVGILYEWCCAGNVFMVNATNQQISHHSHRKKRRSQLKCIQPKQMNADAHCARLYCLFWRRAAIFIHFECYFAVVLVCMCTFISLLLFLFFFVLFENSCSIQSCM